MKKRRGYVLVEVVIAVVILSMTVIHIVNLIVSHKKMEQKLFTQSSKHYETEEVLHHLEANYESDKVQLEKEAVDIEVDDCVLQLQKFRITVPSSNGFDRIYLMIGRGEDS